ncbi:MAG: hypothetical protein ACM30H_13685 [Clostridia bacterium]
MKALFWVAVLALIAVGFGWLRHGLRKVDERRRAEEARIAEFMAQAIARPPATPPDPTAAQQKLLFEAAAKAGEAGEPALAIQLYARLIARYPQSSLAGECRASVERLKARLATPKAPGPVGPG